MVETILLPVDVAHAERWRKAIDVAVGLARQHGAMLHVLYVVPALERNLARLPEHHQPELDRFLASLPADVTVEGELRAGTKRQEIGAAAERVGADLVVMGSHDPRFGDVVIGSHAAQVVLNSRCSVYVVR